MSNRFHNKFHRHNHHTLPTDREGNYPDSGYDPIASPEHPFQGEFYVNGAITTLSSVSAAANLYANNAYLHGDLQVEGNLHVEGTVTTFNTTVESTSALSITNTGTGPALTVTQTGSQPIAHFVDSGGDDIVFQNDGFIGVGTYYPNKKVTVVGDISAKGLVYDETKSSAEWNSVYSSVAETSAHWDSVYSSTAETSATWDSVYSSVVPVSANWNSVYSSATQASAQWDSVYSSVATVSADWSSSAANASEAINKVNGVVTQFAGVSGNWNSVYSSMTLASSDWNDTKNLVVQKNQNWSNSYTVTSLASSNWNSVYSTTARTSSIFLSAGVLTQNTLPRFNQNKQIIDSGISDNGSLVTITRQSTLLNDITGTNAVFSSTISAVRILGNGSGITGVRDLVALPLSGGTLTGGLTGTNAVFEGPIRVTNTGSGDSFIVEDSTNPDATPFVIDNSGHVIVGYNRRFSGFGGTRLQHQVINDSASTATRSGIWNFSADLTDSGIFEFNKSGSATIGASATIVPNSSIGAINFSYFDSTPTQPKLLRGAFINAYADGASVTNGVPGRLSFGTSSGAAGALAVEQMRIDKDGKVLLNNGPLIVNSLSSYKGWLQNEGNLQITGGGTSPRIHLNCFDYDESSSGVLEFIRSFSNTEGNYAPCPVSYTIPNIGLIDFSAADAQGVIKRAAGIQAEIDGSNFGSLSGSVPGRLLFLTTLSGASTANERMRITHDGQIKFGGTLYTNSYVSLQGTVPFLSGRDGNVLYSLRIGNNYSYTGNNIDWTIGVGDTTNISGLLSATTVNRVVGYYYNPKPTNTNNPRVSAEYAFYGSSVGLSMSALSAFGFYSEIGNNSSNPNRWSFYAAGTSPSYFGGNVGVKVKVPNEALTVSGNISATGDIISKGSFATTNYQGLQINSSSYPQIQFRDNEADLTNHWSIWTGIVPTYAKSFHIGPQNTSSSGTPLMTFTRRTSTTNEIGGVGIATSTPISTARMHIVGFEQTATESPYGPESVVRLARRTDAKQYLEFTEDVRGHCINGFSSNTAAKAITLNASTTATTYTSAANPITGDCYIEMQVLGTPIARFDRLSNGNAGLGIGGYADPDNSNLLIKGKGFVYGSITSLSSSGAGEGDAVLHLNNVKSDGTDYSVPQIWSFHNDRSDYGTLNIRHNNISLFKFLSTGEIKIGPGSTDPNEQLTVVGNISAKGNVYSQDPKVVGLLNFYGIENTGTYTRSGNTVTVTMTSHGMTTGQKAYLNFTSGGAASGLYTITSTGTNTFTITTAASGTIATSNVTRKYYIRNSYNIDTISDDGTGLYTIYFTNVVNDAFYSVVASGTQGITSSLPNASDNTVITPFDYTTLSFRIQATDSSSAALVDNVSINVVVIR